MTRNQFLSPLPVVAFLGITMGLFAPLSAWFGWNDPALFDVRGNSYPAEWAEILAVAAVSALFVVPMCWIAIGRCIDIVALQFFLNGMIILGYFFLDLTAPVIHGAERVILTAGEQAVAVNAIGFFTLLTVLVGWYGVLMYSRRGLPPLPVPQAEADRRLWWFLLPVLLVMGVMIASPMLLTGIVPMLAPDPMAGREAIEKNAVARPFYNLASSMLPAMAGSMLVLGLRRKGLLSRFFNLEMMVVGAVMGVQFLTSNRLPIALTLLVFVALLSMEIRLPRPLLVLAGAAFIAFYLGLSGFSSIVRQNREAFSEGNIVEASFREAFLGNNLSDLRDGAWVFGEWDYEPLNGMTYLGAVAAFLPSAVFPAKKDAYLGLVALRIVHWPTEDHFGLRLSFFGESFLNFGLAGTVGLGIVMGSLFGYLLRCLHLAAAAAQPCLARNLVIVLKLQLALTLANSSEGFVFWSLLGLLFLLWLMVRRPVRIGRPGTPVPTAARIPA